MRSLRRLSETYSKKINSVGTVKRVFGMDAQAEKLLLMLLIKHIGLKVKRLKQVERILITLLNSRKI